MKWVLFETWFRNPAKKRGNWRRAFLQTSFQVRMDLYKVQKQGRDEKIKNTTTILRKDGGLLFGLQRNALASLVHFVTYTTKCTRDASALHWRPERRPPSLCARVLSSSHPCLVSVYTFYRSIPTSNEVCGRFFQSFMTCITWGGFTGIVSYSIVQITQ